MLILGAGPIGLGVVQCCKAKGARSIVVGEVAAERQALAKKFGATQVVNPVTEDLVAAVKAASKDGAGATASFDCAGLQKTLEAACLATRPRGMIVNVAIWEKAVPFDPNLLVFGERKLHAGKKTLNLARIRPWTHVLTVMKVLGYRKEDFENVIAAIKDGSIKPESMITRKIAIDRVVEDGFETLVKDKNKQVKILVDLEAS